MEKVTVGKHWYLYEFSQYLSSQLTSSLERPIWDLVNICGFSFAKYTLNWGGMPKRWWFMKTVEGWEIF